MDFGSVTTASSFIRPLHVGHSSTSAPDIRALVRVQPTSTRSSVRRSTLLHQTPRAGRSQTIRSRRISAALAQVALDGASVGVKMLAWYGFNVESNIAPCVAMVPR